MLKLTLMFVSYSRSRSIFTFGLVEEGRSETKKAQKGASAREDGVSAVYCIL